MEFVRKYISEFESFAAKQLVGNKPATLYQPIQYIMGMKAKRFRPVSLGIANHAFGGHIGPSLPLAYCIEMFHNFTLVHDDIMDEAPIRRGKPTVHAKYGQNTGILSGDMMLILAYQYLVKATSGHIHSNKMIDRFNEIAEEVCQGQQMDMNFEAHFDIEIEEYIAMIRKKTAVLLGLSFELGALFAGADSESARNLFHFAMNMGIAFQIQDDILDAFGDPDIFGKQVGGDIIQSKKTYLTIKLLELANAEDSAKIVQLFSGSGIANQVKIDQIMDLYQKYNVKAQANSIQKQYESSAQRFLNELTMSTVNKSLLKDYAASFIKRVV